MKKQIKALFLSMACLLTAAAPAMAESLSDAEPLPSKNLKFKERVHDFGTIKEEDGIVTCDFEFTNEGKIPLTVLYARGGCVCVNAQAPQDPILPGGKARLTVSFNPSYRPGDFSKEIVMLDSEREYSRVWIKGHVIGMDRPVSENYPYEYGSGLWMNLSVMSFGRMKAGESKQVRLAVANDSPEVMRLNFEVDEKTLPAGVKISIPESFVLRPGRNSSMKVTLRLSRDLKGAHDIKIYPVVDGVRLGTALDVKVFGKDY